MMDAEAKLIHTTYRDDELGQQIPVNEHRRVLVTVKSIGQNESFAAGRSGLKAEIRLDVSTHDYNGEKEVQFMEKIYTIYRTFPRIDDEITELYLSDRAGNM